MAPQPHTTLDDELLKQFLSERTATCPMCGAHVEGMGPPFVCPVCGHGLALGLKGVKVLRHTRPWMLAAFGAGGLWLWPLAVGVGVSVWRGTGWVFAERGILGVVNAVAIVVGAILAGYGLIEAARVRDEVADFRRIARLKGVALGMMGCAAWSAAFLFWSLVAVAIGLWTRT